MAETAIRYKTLSIRRTADGFCFMSDLGTVTINNRNFAQALDESGLNPSEYARVLFISSDRKYTLIPSGQFIESEAESLLRFALPQIAETDKVLHYPVAQLMTEIIYSIDSAMESAVRAIIPDVRFIPHISPIIQYLMAKTEGGTALWINIEDKSADIIAISNGKLLLAESIVHKGDYDTLYSVLGILKGLQLQKPAILLSGDTAGIEPNLKRMAGKVIHLFDESAGIPVDLSIISQ